MQKRKKELIVIAALIPVFLIVIVSAVQKMRARSLRVNAKTATNTVTQNVEESVAVDDQPQQWHDLLEQQRSRELQYLGKGFNRDPFVFEKDLYTDEEILLTLNGLVSQPEHGAIVNGEIVTQGSFVKGFMVKEIKNNEIVLQRSGRQFRLIVGHPLKLIVRKRK